jgi:hypothetical protein
MQIDGVVMQQLMLVMNEIVPAVVCHQWMVAHTYVTEDWITFLSAAIHSIVTSMDAEWMHGESGSASSRFTC